MNGIVGDKPVLTYSPIRERCTASFPGYEEDVAQLPLDTVDAVLTSNGMLVYKDSKNEVRGISLPNHGEILRAVHGVKPLKTFANCLTADKLVVGKMQALSFQEKEADLRSMVHQMAADLIRQKVDPLVTEIQELKAENKRLSDRIDEMQERKRLAAKILQMGIQGTKPAEMPLGAENKMRSTSAAENYDALDAIQPAWGDQGGLVSGLLPEEGNPFCGRLRRR
jgi:regulator of replication initiation timing